MSSSVVKEEPPTASPAEVASAKAPAANNPAPENKPPENKTPENKPRRSVADEALKKVSILRGQYVIETRNRLRHFDTPNSQAYRATRQIDQDDSYFVLIGKRSPPPRISMVEQLNGIEFAHCLNGLAWDTVRGRDGGERPVVVFPIPRGQFYMSSLTDRVAPLSPDVCISRFLRPVSKALKAYHSFSLTHRAISPTNLFVDYGGRSPDFTLGQCVSEAPGTVQPMVFETITCGLCSPEGRGRESPANDIYAMAVMLITLLHGRVPMGEKTADHIIRRKIRTGSYSAIVEGFPLPTSLVEPIRGMLNDNPNERWTLQHIDAWMQGRQVTAKQYFLFTKGKVPFHLDRVACSSRHDLAHEMSINWEESLEYAGNTEIAQWVRRSLGDEERGKVVLNLQSQAGSVVHGLGEQAGGGVHMVLARLLAVLDPLGPIRCQGVHFTPSGLGQMMLKHLHNRRSIHIIKQIIYQELIKFWYRYHIQHTASYGSVIHELNLALHGMAHDRSEYGLERILYSLNHDLPCLSKFFEKSFVYGLDLFMDVTEKELRQKPAGYVFNMDRHMISYISVHNKHISLRILRGSANVNNPVERAIGQARLLGNLQNDFGKKAYPNICKQVCKMMEVVIKDFNNLPLQERMRKRIYREAEHGEIQSIIDIVDDMRIKSQDNIAYEKARAEYRMNTKKLTEISSAREHLYRDARDRSHEFAVTVCALAAGLGLLMLL